MHPADQQYPGFPTFADWADSRVAEELWEQSLALLAERRALAAPTVFETMAEQATRMASIDTGAIEGLYTVDRGFTVTVASMASAWEAQIQRVKGPDVAAFVAAQRAAYDLALDAATSQTELSEAWIRQLHQVVCEPQDTYLVQTAVGPQRHPLPKGQYKKAPNHVELADGSVVAYAPVEETPAEMHRLVIELRSPGFANAHPVLQSAYAHDAFVRIHPFADGNGRVARALTSVFLFRATSLPFVIFADQKDAYVSALEAADHAGSQAFVDFVLRRAVDLQQLVAERLREATGTSIDEAAVRLANLSDARAMLAVLREHAAAELRSQLGSLALPNTIRWYVTVGDPNVDLRVTMPSPPDTAVQESFAFSVDGGVTTGPTLVVRRRWPSKERIEIRSDEVRPSVSAVLDARMKSWLRRVVSEMLADLATKAQRM